MNHFLNYVMNEYKFILHDISLEKRQSKFVSCDQLVIKKNRWSIYTPYRYMEICAGLPENLYRLNYWRHTKITFPFLSQIFCLMSSTFYENLCNALLWRTNSDKVYLITVRFFIWVRNIRKYGKQALLNC